MICGCIVSTKAPPSSRMPANSASQISRTSPGVEMRRFQLGAAVEPEVRRVSRIHWIGNSTRSLPSCR